MQISRGRINPNLMSNIFLRARRYLFTPRFHFNRLQFNLITLFFISLGLLIGSYLTAKNIIPKIFAISQASITVDTDTDFNNGTLSSTSVSGTGSPSVIKLTGSAGPNGTNYKRITTISNSGSALTKYQVLITLDTASLITAGKLQSNCADLYFLDTDNTTEIPNYYVDNCDSSTTRIWVKVPSIAASPATTTIYLYYGNPSASALSSFSNTFPATGQQVWLKADAISGVSNGSQFGIWNDSSGTGNNFTQSSTSREPTYETNVINGEPVVRMSASSSQTMSNATNFTSPVSVIYAARQTGGTNQRMLSALGNNWLMGYWSGGKDQAYFSGWNTPSGSPTTDTKWHIFSSTESTSQANAWDNGAQFVTNGTSATGPNGLCLSGYECNSEFSDGDFAELFVYNSVLSNNDRGALERYLSAKYSITLNSSDPASSSVGTESVSLASSGTWESASNSNVLDTVWNGGWGDGSSGSSTAFSATVASVSADQTIAFQMRTASSTAALTSASYVTLGTVNSGTTFSQTKTQLDNLGLGTGTNRYIQVKVTLAQTTGTSPTLDKFTIYYASDNTSPETNATSPLMYSSNGGTSIASSGWDNASSPYFTWTAGSDSQSGIKGYCLYLGTSNSANPTTSSPGDLSSTNSPVSVSGTQCDGGNGFIVSGTSIDLSTSGYIGTALTSSSSPYYLGVAAVDNAGNTDSSFTFFPFYFDNTAPTNVAYTSCASGNFSNVTDMNFSWPTSGSSASSDSDSGVLGWQYQINSSTGTWQGTTHNATLNLDYIPATASAYTLVSSRDSSAIASGANIVYFRTVDLAGNLSSSSMYRTCSLSYGGAAPTFPGNGTVTISPSSSTTNSFALSWPAATATTGQTVTHYYYMINNSPPSTLSTLQGNTTTYIDNGTTLTVAAKALANVNKGTNTIYVVAIDNAGTPNYSPSNDITGTFTLNSTNPDPVQNLLASDSSIKSTSTWNVTLTWTAGVYQGAGNLTYNVYRSTDGVTFSKVGSTSGLSYVDNTPSSTLYYYYVVTQDGANATSANSTTVYLTPTGKYTSPPVLQSGPTAGSITTQSVTITWSTDRNGDSKVAYGTSSGNYGTTEPYVSTQVTSHSVTISNLSPGTTYYYKVYWTDTDGNTGSSSEESFSTSPPPTVSSVTVSNISLSSALVTFTTNNASQAKILYGVTTSYGGATTVSTGATSSTYSIPLTDLLDGTTYHFEIQLEDASGTIYTFEDHQFSTLPRPKISTIQIDQVAGTAQPTILVSWISNTDISSIVTYPLGNLGASKDNIDVALTHGNHQMLLSGLDPKTTYQLIVKGRDKVGNEAVSDTQTFTTATDTRPPYISALAIEGSSIPSVASSGQPQVAQLVVTWNTDKAATSQVEYGEGTGNSYSQKTQQDGNYTFNHLVIISGLTPSKVYHVKALSVDKYGNSGESVDTVTITPNATSNALNLVIGNLQQAFGFLGAINSGGGQ